jgi:tripeptidyl-peptidase I
VSDPFHPRYGQHLTANEVKELVAPTQQTLLLVEEWLEKHEIFIQEEHYSPAFDWITISLPIHKVETLLQTEYYEFEDGESRSIAIRAPTWSLPRYLHDHIDSIQPTTKFMYTPWTMIDFPRRSSDFPTTAKRSDNDGKVESLNEVAEEFLDDSSLDLDNLPSDLTVKQACNASAVTPLCIRTLYGTFDYKAKAGENNTMALINYGGEFNNRSDLQTFLESYRPDAARAGVAFEFPNEDVAGGQNQQSPVTAEQLKHKVGREGALDAQTLLGIAYPARLMTYSVGDVAPPFKADKYTPTNTNEPFLTWLQYILAKEDSELPKVIATSYGDIEQTVPYSYAKRVCDSFAQLGARGVSVIFGAGDSGVGKDGYCRSNNGSDAFEFLTSFPASCPYGTSVGATRNVEPEEIVAYNERNGFVSGGGFSKYFPRPAYQNARSAVDTYLDRLGSNTYSGLFNHRGRGYPDVAAQGYRRVIVWNGRKYLVDGTSASAPTFAAVVALVNDALISEGKPTLGFLNPWLYQVGFQAFKDVTKGSNKGCGTEGFEAEKGWDPASGFGTPVSLLLVALEHHIPHSNLFSHSGFQHLKTWH